MKQNVGQWTNILAVHGVPAEDTVDGAVLNGIYK